MTTITDLREKGLAAWLHETETEFDFIDFDFIEVAGPCETETELAIEPIEENDWGLAEYEAFMNSPDLHDWQMENCYSED